MALPATAEAQRRKRRKRKPKPAPKPTPAEVAPAPEAPAPAPDLGSDDDDAEAPAKPGKSDGKGKKDPEVFDFTGMDLSGRMRTPQLLYFLDRANEELERAALERRSFIPEMARSVDEEAL